MNQEEGDGLKGSLYLFLLLKSIRITARKDIAILKKSVKLLILGIEAFY